MHTITINNNNHYDFYTTLLFFKNKCNLSSTEGEEIIKMMRFNNYSCEDEYTIHTIPILQTNKSYEILFENNTIVVTQTSSFQEHVAGMDRTIKTLKSLKIQSNEKHIFDTLLQEINKFKHNNLSHENNNVINHYIATPYGEWDKSDSYPLRSIDTLYLQHDMKQNLLDDITHFFKNETINNIYEKMGIPKSRTYLFYGYPGTGKTTTCNILASYLNMNIGTIDFTKEINDQRLRIIFKNIPKNTILLIEDIDRLVSKHELTNEFTLSGLLNILDGINKVNKLICIITCNDISVLDKALVRRISYSIEFKKILYENQLIDFTNNIDIFKNDDEKKKFVAFFKNKESTINVLQKWILTHLPAITQKKYDIIDKLDEFSDFNKWYNNLMTAHNIYL